VAVDRKLMTAEELLLLPDDGMRHELIDGELRTMAPAGAEHGHSAGPIHGHISRFLFDHPIAYVWAAETGFLLRRRPDRVRAPDVSVLRLERIPPEGVPRGYFPGAPDLAVEVVSPGDTASEVLDKVDDWLRAGARAVWVVYPSPVRLFVHRADGSVQQLGPDDEVDGDEILPGFRMRVRDLLHPFRR
jgi:Uma2 family endonuclease